MVIYILVREMEILDYTIAYLSPTPVHYGFTTLREAEEEIKQRASSNWIIKEIQVV